MAKHECSAKCKPARRQSPNSNEYTRYFAATRQPYDIIAAVCTVTVVPAAVILRTFQGFAGNPEAAASVFSYPWLSSFPQDSPPVYQAIWVAMRVLWLPGYLGLYCGLQAYAVALLLTYVLLFAAWKQPDWYLEGGRSILMTCIRFTVSIDAAAKLLLGWTVHSVHLNFIAAVYSSGRTVLWLLWLTAMYQVPFSLQIKIIIPELFLFFSLKTMASSSQSTLAWSADGQAQFLSFLFHAICGAAFPTVLTALQEYSIRRNFMASTRTAAPHDAELDFLQNTNDTGLSDEKLEKLERLENCPFQDPDTRPAETAETPKAVLKYNANPSTSHSQPMNLHRSMEVANTNFSSTPDYGGAIVQPADDTSCSLPPANHNDSATASQLTAAQMDTLQEMVNARRDIAKTALLQRLDCTEASMPGASAAPIALYRSRTRQRLISVKIHDHDAFARREEVSATVEQHLREVYSQHPGASVQLQVASWEGCLQLLISITDDHRDDEKRDINSCTEDPAVEWLSELLLAVPEDIRNSPCLIHSPADRIALATKGKDDRPTQLTQLTQLTSKSSHSLMSQMHMCIAPVCVESGVLQPNILDLNVSFVTEEGTGTSVPIEVVARFKQQNQDASIRLQGLDADSVIRLSLPAAISPGPFSVHILSCQPGQEGALLGSLTTVALPPPAAQELRHMLDLHAADPQLKSCSCELLQDMAFVWGHLPPTSSAAHLQDDLQMTQQEWGLPVQDVQEGLLQFFKDNDMVNCSEAFSTRSCVDQPLGKCSSRADSSARPSGVTSHPACLPEKASGFASHPACLPEPRLPRTSSLLRHSLFGFTDRSTEHRYALHRCGRSTLMTDTFCMLWYIVLVCTGCAGGGHTFMRGAMWRVMGDSLCAGAYALMVSPLRPQLADSRCRLLCGSRAVASSVQTAAYYMQWYAANPAVVKQLAKAKFDIIYCLQFPLLYQATCGGWLLAAAAGEAFHMCQGFAGTIGIKAAVVRIVMGYILGVGVVLRMDVLARTAFLKQEFANKVK